MDEENARNSTQLREAMNGRLYTIVIFRGPSRNVTMTVGLLGREMIRTLEPELFEAAAQCARIDAELFSSAPRPVDSPVRLVEHMKHMPALYIL